MNKRKIINDPVYGFITISHDLVFDLIEHPWFQRLRRIQQLGLTHYVYPGALHTRFHHAIGAMHLMQQALEVLRSKDHTITNEESEAACVAILLHDIGHGPFSHALEKTLSKGIRHEDLSLRFMQELNKSFEGRLTIAIKIFRNEYEKKFLHQLVSGQLDMDRLDYLNRDSFFTGVHEGVIGYDRIIKMLNIHDDELVVESKGIYSIEKFLIARRLMYWQVYLHKTVLSAEQMLVKIMQRAKELAERGEQLFTTPAFSFFLSAGLSKEDFGKKEVLDKFAGMDDFDIYTSIKVWQEHSDKVLSYLCRSLIQRKLFKLEMQKEPFADACLDEIKSSICNKMDISEAEAGYLVFTNSTSNSAYSREANKINILYKNGATIDIAEASDQLNITVLSGPVVKHYLCFPKDWTIISNFAK